MAVVLPPRSTAVSSPNSATTPSQRNQQIQMSQAKRRFGCEKTVGYGRQSHAATVVFRYKGIIDYSLCAWTLPAQKIDAKVTYSVLNRMTCLDRLVS